MPRYYTGEALQFPQMVTQKFWDEMTEIRRQYKEDKEKAQSEGRQFIWVDTTYGSDDLGPRPKYPQWMVDYVEPMLLFLALLSWPVVFGFFYYKIKHP